MKSFTAEEERLHGPYGVKLIHHEDTSKRIWVLRCDNASQQSQWIQVSHLYPTTISSQLFIANKYVD